jgi:hypothetical protein
MDIKILKIHNKGNQNEEYVELYAYKKCDIGKYVISDSTYTEDGKISNKLRHIYWFPDKIVSSEDSIFLYTKTGINDDFINKSKTKTHRFYWNIARPIWNDSEDCGVLMLIEDWMCKKVY